MSFKISINFNKLRDFGAESFINLGRVRNC